MKNFIKKIIGEKGLLLYHKLIAIIACVIYRFPAHKLKIIAITGTKGKTTSAYLIYKTLNTLGFKTGLISTIAFSTDGQNKIINDKHMTMPGRFFVQGMLRKMYLNGCKYVVLEATSEGIKQSRHTCLKPHIAVFTNLSPEHLPSHNNSFDEYKKTKGKLFKNLPKNSLSLVNSDDENASYFLSLGENKKQTFSIDKDSDFRAKNIQEELDSVKFDFQDTTFNLNLIGRFNVYNALVAIAVAKYLGASTTNIANALLQIKGVPGRMEEIKDNQDFRVFIDYAHEELSMRSALQASRVLAGGNSVIVLLGAEGGGRDKSKRSKMARVATELADYIVVSNVDPYDENPQNIIKDITQKAEEYGAESGKNLFAIEDRREGIKKALELADTGDIVLITGKGVETTMEIAGKTIPWSDKTITKELLKEIYK